MSEQKNILTKFYYPQCKEIGCNGLLNIKFGDIFTLEYECDINKNHNKKNIFFKTFERFYLKEKEIEKCSNCYSIVDGDIFYKCKKCDKYYCTICFIKDEHIKNDMNNIGIETKKCKLHKRELNYFCIDCKKNICIYCLKNDDDHNKNHNIINLIELMPTKKQIINLKIKIKERNELYEEIIKSINEWEKTLLTKTNRLKENFKNEISLLRKIIDNYNIYFLNYTYYSTFHLLEDYIKNKNNKIFEKLKNSKNFEEKKDIIFEIFNLSKNNMNNKIELIKGDLESYYSIKNGIIEKISNTFYFEFLKDENNIYISKYDQKLDQIKVLFESNFNENIYSVSISQENSQIYTCLSNKKIVKIIDYDLNQKRFTNINNAINDTNDSILYFNKCISISNGLLATADNKNITLWGKTNNISNNYNKIKVIQIYGKTSDLLLANSEYFISSQPEIKTITIIEIKSLEPIKYIPNIDCIDSFNCFLLFKDYIIINCKKGIALLLIKTKEISQYIENIFEISENKKIFLDSKDNICIWSQKKKGNLILFNERYYLTIKKLKINNGLFIFEDFGFIESHEEISKIFCLNDKDLIFQGDNIYLLKDEK